jgi:Teichoic acid biosynthesis proteins
MENIILKKFNSVADELCYNYQQYKDAYSILVLEPRNAISWKETRRLVEHFFWLDIAGFFDGYFKDQELENVWQEVRDTIQNIAWSFGADESNEYYNYLKWYYEDYDVPDVHDAVNKNSETSLFELFKQKNDLK